MTATAQATWARRTGDSTPVAGEGPVAQDALVTATNGALSGQGGQVRLNAGSAGNYVLPLPTPNTVSLVIEDLGGHAHVVNGAFNGGTTLTFSGVAGSWVELFAAVDGQSWVPSSLQGVALS